MQPITCTALLKDTNGKLLEIGTVGLSDLPNTLDFQGPFVPLFKMGTKLVLIPVINQIELNSITGEVYLSTGNFLRLTAIPEADLTELRAAFYINIELAVELAHYQPSTLYYSYKRAEKIDVCIYHIDLSGLRFMTLHTLSIGQKFMLNQETPISLKKVILQVIQIIDFGEMAHSYQCRFLELGDEAGKNIQHYLDYGSGNSD